MMGFIDPFESSGSVRRLDVFAAETTLVCAKEGGRSTEVRRTKFDVRRFQHDAASPFVVLPAGQYDAVLASPGCDRGYLFHFPADVFQAVLPGEDAFPDLHVVAGGFRHSRLLRLADAAVRAAGDPLLLKELRYAMAHVLLELEGRSPSLRGQRPFPVQTMRSIDDYIRARLCLGERIDLDDLMALAGLGATHFRSGFRSSFDTSPHEYVQNLRVKLAGERLCCGDEPVSTIAMTFGFSTPAHFSTLFKRINGMSPIDYRRRHRR